MTRRLHLAFDAIGQLLIVGAFIYLLISYTSSNKAFWDNFRFYTLFSTLWQLIHAVVSTKVYDNPLRRNYLRVVGWTFIWVVLALGLLYFLSVLLLQWSALGMGVLSVMEWVFMILMWTPYFVFLGFIGWYYFLTAKDIHIVLNKTI